MKVSVTPTLLKLHPNTFFRICLTLATLLFIGLKGHTQLSFGLKSGINIATVKDINSDPKNRVGVYAGGIINIPVEKSIFLQPELLFSAKGYRYIGNLNQTAKTSTRLNYLSLPFLFGYKIDKKTSLLGGPEFGYLLSAYSSYPGNEKSNVSNNFPQKFDIGLDIGLNYKICDNAGIEIRYNYGFKSMYITDAVGVRIGEKLAGNRVFQIGMNYTL